jgi:hypothetical protein
MPTFAFALVLLLAARLPLRSASADGEDRFDLDSRQEYAGYSEGGANWSVDDGRLIGSGPARQSVLLRRGVRAADGWVETESSRADDGGLVLRFVDASDYYLLAFRDDQAPAPRGERNLALYHHEHGRYDEMWSRDVDWPRGTLRRIRFSADGPRLRVELDGVSLVTHKPAQGWNDASPSSAAGGMGMRHYGADAGWITHFEVFRWHTGP